MLNKVKKFLLIVKVILLNSLGNFQISFSKKPKNSLRAGSTKKSKIGLFILLLVCWILVMFNLYAAGIETLKLAKEADVVKELLNVFLPIVLLLIVFFSFNTIVSNFFYSNDNTTFLHLPIKVNTLFIARFICSIVSIYFLEILFLLPFGVAYVVVLQPSIYFYLSALLFFFLAPILPIVFTYILALIIDRFVHIQEHKDGFTIAMLSIMVIGIFAFSFISPFIFNSTSSDTVDMIAIFKENITSIHNNIKGLDIFTDLITSSMVTSNVSNLLDLLIFIAITMACAIMAILISKKHYLKTILNSGQVHKKNISQTKKDKMTQKELAKKPLRTIYVKKEIRSLMRSPMMVFQLLFPIVMFSLFFVAMFIGSIVLAISGNTAVSEEINSMKGFMFLIGLGLLALFLGMNLISASNFSREGKSAYLLKTFPIAPYKHIIYKSILPISIDIVFIIIMSLSLIILRIDLLFVLVITICAIGLVILLNLLCTLFDLKFPLLDWDNELAAVKNGKNITIPLLLTFLITFIFIGLSFIFLNFPHLYLLSYLLGFAVIGGLNALMIVYFIKSKEKLLANIN